MKSIIISFIFGAVSLFNNRCEINIPAHFDTTYGRQINVNSIGVDSFNLKLYNNLYQDVDINETLDQGTYYYEITYLCNDGISKKKEGNIELIKTIKR